MHDTAMRLGELFFRHYLRGEAPEVLDLGAMDINGSLRSVAPPGLRYCGADMETGPGVDVVLDGSGRLPFEDGRFDAVVCTSVFEHAPAFWETFLEMLRVTRPGGYLYVNAPSNGETHRFPLDCWRFYADASVALESWGRTRGFDIRAMESFIAPRMTDQWEDCVMVFGREAPPPGSFIHDDLPDAMQLRRLGELAASVGPPPHLTTDQILLRQARERIAALEAELAALRPGGAPPSS